MPLSTLGAATRAFVSVLLVLSRSYLLALEVNRDSTQEHLVKAYRKVLLKVHPDKGGKKEDAQRLQEAKETWDKARKGSAGKDASPKTGANEGAVVCHQRKEFRVNAAFVLLTYQGVADLHQWPGFPGWGAGYRAPLTAHRAGCRVPRSLEGGGGGGG